MKTHRELQQLGLDSFTMSRFTGTSAYYRISRRHLLTHGTKHLAEKAACFWMMDAIASHLCEIGTEDWFVVVHVKVSEGRAVIAAARTSSPSTPGAATASPQPSRPSADCRRSSQPQRSLQAPWLVTIARGRAKR